MAKKEEKGSNKKQSGENKKIKMKKNKIIVIGIIAAVAVGVAYAVFASTNTTKSSNVVSSFPAVDGIPCESQEYVIYHIHAHMDIFVNGVPFKVPALIGFQDNICLYWLHTHNTDGLIHMESPRAWNFTLGQFYDMWHVTGLSQPPDGEPIIYLNGQKVTTKIADTPLKAHDEVVLVYGNPPSFIPAFYQFPEGV